MTELDFDTPEPRFDSETGLVPAIVQDARSGRVLMLGYMNQEALDRTISNGRVTFFSRSRDKLWTKGETSGNWLEVREVRTDCDGDALLIRATPHGPTCHTGAVSCFAEPETPNLGEVLGELFDLIEKRKSLRPPGSYTVRLFEGGNSAISRKVAEEAMELALDAVESGGRAAEETADLLYHTLVLLSALDVSPEDVATTLANRHA